MQDFQILEDILTENKEISNIEYHCSKHSYLSKQKISCYYEGLLGMH